MLGCHPRIAVPEVVWYYPRFRPYLYSYGDLSKSENLRTLAQEMVFGLKTPFWGMKVNPRTIVDEILGETPDRRGVAEQLVRVQIHAAVVSVAVVEVPVPHEDFELLQLPERLLA